MAAKAEDDHKVGSIEEEDVEQLILKSGVPKSGDQKARKFEIDKVDAELSKFVTTILEEDSEATLIEIRQLLPETLDHVVTYLQHHKGKEPGPLQCPIKSSQMAHIVSDKWDANWIDDFDKQTVVNIILGAHYMDIKSLVHLGCAKIASIIKALDCDFAAYAQKELSGLSKSFMDIIASYLSDVD